MLHQHLAHAETHVVTGVLAVVTDGHRRRPIAVQHHRPILRQIRRQRTVDIPVNAGHAVLRLTFGGLLVRLVQRTVATAVHRQR